MALAKATSPSNYTHCNAEVSNAARKYKHGSGKGNSNIVYFLGKEVVIEPPARDGAPVLDLPIDLRCEVSTRRPRSALTEALRKMAAAADCMGDDYSSSMEDESTPSGVEHDDAPSTSTEFTALQPALTSPQDCQTSDELSGSPTSSQSLPGWFV